MSGHLVSIIRNRMMLRPFISSSFPRFNSTSSSINKQLDNGNGDEAETISYSKSKSSHYKAADNYFVYYKDDSPRPSNIQVLSFCLFAIGAYCMIREPNDLDEDLEKPIFERMPHLERPMLETALVNSYNQGLPTKHIVERLKELEAQGK